MPKCYHESAARVGRHVSTEQSRQKHNFKAEDQSRDSYKISKSETACVPQATVSFDKWLHQFETWPRALATPFRQKAVKMFFAKE